MDNYDFLDIPDAERIQAMNAAFPSANSDNILAFIAFQHVYQQVDTEYATLLQDYGLSESRFLILMFLRRSGAAGLSPSDIAVKLNSAKPTASKLIHGMIQTGLVAKKTDAKDLRRFNVQITSKGSQQLDRFLPVNFDYLNHLFHGLTTEEKSQLNRLLAKLLR